MRNKSPRARAASASLDIILPLASKLSLVQMRDHLRLLAGLIDHPGEAAEAAARFTPDSMAWCLTRMAQDLDDVIVAAHPKLN
ncbi:hypothetical protein LF41_2267 [Lysobacter dokdonensis DS-58]|uniref:XAC0095-like domain-containing protein n=1 Tax=Lysobacter dokdonensis DS-58 TaxID=1300345 RepID=A0A0A2WNA8_9GAMM|nr:hypothetical protein [Lysobacter dokdonensis]KGQ19765.1 hypothetical protein LF41_2267 [Lysobacter dokdonensis DS-58]